MILVAGGLVPPVSFCPVRVIYRLLSFSAAVHKQTGLCVGRSAVLRMAVWPMGSVLQGLQRSVISLHPAVNVLSVSTIVDHRFCDAILLRVVDQGLPIQGGLCYLIHGE